MRSGAASDFREASKHEDELTERQREILALIEKGHTNREIGEMLGISVDGAKWNVSEILSKLGLASREEAAEYWRWRDGAVRSRVRALLGAPLARVVGAGAVAVAGAGVVVALMSADEPPAEDVPGRPFYLEAEVRVSSNARSIGTNIPGGADPANVEESSGLMRWWWQDSDHFHFEYETREPAIKSGTTAVVGDGATQWVYREPENVFSRGPLEPIPGGYRVRPMTFSLFIGPLPLPENVNTVDEAVEAMNGWRGDGEGWAKVVGTDVYLGRHVEVVEFGPLGCSGGGLDSQGLQTREECYGFSRIWIDPNTMMVLKQVGDDEGRGLQSFEARVTTLDYDVSQPPEKFQFEPPPGAIEQAAGEDSGDDVAVSSGGPGAPPGFLRLDSLPAGYRWSGASGTQGATSTFAVSLAGPDGAELRIMQRRAPLLEDLRGGVEYAVHGVVAYGLQKPDGDSQLAWEEAGVTIVIEADALSVEELVAVAELMRLVE